MRGLLFLAACALAVNLNFVPLSSFSAQFNASSATAYYISSYNSISGDCSTYSSLYPYVTFNYTFATAGVRFINAINAEAVHVTTGGYNTSNLCQNTTGTVWPLEESSGNNYAGYAKQYGHYFEANMTYTIFVFGSVATSLSSATIAELWDTNFNGQLTVSNTTNNSMWMPVEYDSSSPPACSQTSTNVFFSTQVISVNTSGVYNIFAVFGQNFHLPYSYQTPSRPRLAVLRGSFMDTNVTSATCATLGSNFIGEGADSESAVSVLGVQLDANQVYTIVVSATTSTDIEAVWQGHYGITVAPTGFGQFSQASTLRPFQRPTIGSCDEACTSDSSNTTSNPYGVYYFTVPQNSLVYLYAEDGYGMSGADFQWYLYNEHNSVGLTGPSTCGFPLQTCIYDVDTMTGVIVDTGSATDLTLIATSWSASRQYPTATFTVVTVSGPKIGSVPTSRAPTPGSSTAPTSQLVNQTNSTQTNSTTAPTQKGQTMAPTSRRPTKVGETYAPTPAGAVGVNAGSVSQPCMFGLIASLAVLVKLL